MFAACVCGCVFAVWEAVCFGVCFVVCGEQSVCVCVCGGEWCVCDMGLSRAEGRGQLAGRAADGRAGGGLPALP